MDNNDAQYGIVVESLVLYEAGKSASQQAQDSAVGSTIQAIGEKLAKRATKKTAKGIAEPNKISRWTRIGNLTGINDLAKGFSKNGTNRGRHLAKGGAKAALVLGTLGLTGMAVTKGGKKKKKD